jgi:hypothetical protein
VAEARAGIVASVIPITGARATGTGEALSGTPVVDIILAGQRATSSNVTGGLTYNAPVSYNAPYAYNTSANTARPNITILGSRATSLHFAQPITILGRMATSVDVARFQIWVQGAQVEWASTAFSGAAVITLPIVVAGTRAGEVDTPNTGTPNIGAPGTRGTSNSTANSASYALRLPGSRASEVDTVLDASNTGTLRRSTSPTERRSTLAHARRTTSPTSRRSAVATARRVSVPTARRS